MRFFKGTFPSLPKGLNVIANRYAVGVAETQLAITTLAGGTSIVGSPPAGRVYLIELRNSSGTGQIIRVGIAPTFTGPSGLPLMPGDTLELASWALSLAAIANAAGAVLDVEIVRTA